MKPQKSLIMQTFQVKIREKEKFIVMDWKIQYKVASAKQFDICIKQKNEAKQSRSKLYMYLHPNYCDKVLRTFIHYHHGNFFE